MRKVIQHNLLALTSCAALCRPDRRRRHCRLPCIANAAAEGGPAPYQPRRDVAASAAAAPVSAPVPQPYQARPTKPAKTAAVDGNEATARIAYALSDTCFV